MREYINEFSKYAITILMALYTYESFAVFRFSEDEDRRGIYARQSVLMFVMQFICFADLAVMSRNVEYVFFYAFVQIFLLAVIKITEMVYERSSRLLTNNMCLLLGTGFCMIARLQFDRALKQYIIVMVSFILALFVPYLLSRPDFFKKLTWLYAGAGIVLLGTVLLTGEVTHGSKLSFAVGDVTFQPSEVVKLVFIFFLAAALWKDASFQRVVVTSVLAGIQVLILVISRDLGSALIFFVGFLFVVYVATGRRLYLLAGAAGGSLAAVAAYFIFDHIKVRVLAWQDPFAYIENQGYQIAQSLFAIGNGGWFGTGLLNGSPGSIPYVAEDFIFSAVCEELGVVYGICLILVCLSCFVMMMDTSVRTKDRFFQLLSFGLGIMYIFQIFLTVGGGIKFIPLTGVTLPFVSYGGSSVLTSMLLFFVIQAVYVKLPLKGGKVHAAKKEKD